MIMTTIIIITIIIIMKIVMMLIIRMMMIRIVIRIMIEMYRNRTPNSYRLFAIVQHQMSHQNFD